MKIISGSINVSAFEKERFISGKKGTYANITIMLNDEQDQYGNNGMITQSVSKEERQSGTRGPILGNVKVVWDDQSGGGGHPEAGRAEAPPADFDDKEIPF